MKCRVNPSYLTTDALREAAKKIKWNEKFYTEFFDKLRNDGVLKNEQKMEG